MDCEFETKPDEDAGEHLGRRFQKADVVFPGDALPPLLADDPLVLHVALVAQDHPLHVLVRVFVWTWVW